MTSRFLSRWPRLGALAAALLLACGPAATSAATPTPEGAQAPAAPTPGAAKSSPAAAASPATGAVVLSPSPAARASSPPRITARSAPRSQAADPTALRLDLQLVTKDLEQPVQVTHAPDGSGRLFVVERRGRISIVRDGARAPTPFLDITPLVGSGGSEQGLLGLAFHPSYASNGQLFVNYTDRSGDTVVARLGRASGDPDRADPNSAVQVLWVDQPAANHNGGNLVFGPDGYLWIGLGDGGGSGDRFGNGQNPRSLLGKMLRIDVDASASGGYAIPPDNPFVGRADWRPEIWAYGLRNPWRYSFDRLTGDLYIADVGQNTWEEVHLQRAGTGAGANYGWPRMEGRHCHPPGSACDPSGLEQPVAEYDRSGGCSITGGHVYRGAAYPRMAGLYFDADYCSGKIWALDEPAPGAWRSTLVLQTSLRISSFGEDEAGELYLVSLSDNGLYRLTAE